MIGWGTSVATPAPVPVSPPSGPPPVSHPMGPAAFGFALLPGGRPPTFANPARDDDAAQGMANELATSAKIPILHLSVVRGRSEDNKPGRCAIRQLCVAIPRFHSSRRPRIADFPDAPNDLQRGPIDLHAGRGARAMESGLGCRFGFCCSRTSSPIRPSQNALRTGWAPTTTVYDAAARQ